MKTQSLDITEATQNQRARRWRPKELRTTLVDTVRTQRVHPVKHPKELTAKRTRSRTRTSVIWPSSRRRLDAELRLRQSGGTLTHRSSAVETGEGTIGGWGSGSGRSCTWKAQCVGFTLSQDSCIGQKLNIRPLSGKLPSILDCLKSEKVMEFTKSYFMQGHETLWMSVLVKLMTNRNTVFVKQLLLYHKIIDLSSSVKMAETLKPFSRSRQWSFNELKMIKGLARRCQTMTRWPNLVLRAIVFVPWGNTNTIQCWY